MNVTLPVTKQEKIKANLCSNSLCGRAWVEGDFCPTCGSPPETEAATFFENKQSISEPALRFDAGKVPLADFDIFFDDGFAAEIGKAFRYGAIKYGKDNWKKGMSWSRSINSARRHLLSWTRGEKFDAESGCHHLALCICSIMFLFVYERETIGKDDR